MGQFYFGVDRQAAEHGGQVRKGEHGSLVVYAGKIIKSKDNGAGKESERSIPFLRGYTVFNVDQIDGPAVAPAPAAVVTPIDAAERFIARCGADVRHGGDRAFYSIQSDRIQMPHVEQFRDAEGYAATKIHEVTHGTGHKSRLAGDSASASGTLPMPLRSWLPSSVARSCVPTWVCPPSRARITAPISLRGSPS